MIEIGKARETVVRVRKPGTRILVPKFGDNDLPVTRMVAAEVTRVTKKALDGSFGSDRGRKLVIRLRAGDLLEIRPHRTRQPLSAPLDEVYRWLVQRKANSAHLQKARETKAQKMARRQRLKMKADERRLLRPL